MSQRSGPDGSTWEIFGLIAESVMFSSRSVFFGRLPTATAPKSISCVSVFSRKSGRTTLHLVSMYEYSGLLKPKRFYHPHLAESPTYF